MHESDDVPGGSCAGKLYVSSPTYGVCVACMLILSVCISGTIVAFTGTVVSKNIATTNSPAPIHIFFFIFVFHLNYIWAFRYLYFSMEKEKYSFINVGVVRIL